MSIKPLSQNTVKFLTTTQVITSVVTAVKELVENSIDAQAKRIEINLNDNGATLIEVSDDGKGISREDTPFMALQSYTSKIGDFNDLDSLESYGFRGEALNSLCKVSDVTLITKTKEDDVARSYKLNHNGDIENCELCYHSIGTTVRAKYLFKDLPVRRQLLTASKNSSQEVKNLLLPYAICQPQMRINLRANGSVLLTKPSTASPKETLSALFGNKFASQVDFVEKNIYETTIHLSIPRKDATELSELCQAGQYTCVNKRPVIYKEFEKTINKRLVEYFGEKIPSKKKLAFVLDLQVLTSNVDVNLEPNKTKIFLTNQSKISEALDQVLTEYYELEPKMQDIARDKIALVDESTEYFDCTSTEMSLSAENFNSPACKKRKIDKENKKTPGKPNRRVEASHLNKENRSSNAAQKIDDSLEEMTETISQLPVVDLGEDFTVEEISGLPNLKAEQVSTVLNDVEVHNGNSNSNETKGNGNFTLEAWSKGQGGTDVQPYGNVVKNVMQGESKGTREEPDPSSTGCKGFLKFSKEMRRQIIEENPGINFVEVATTLTKRWKELSPEERGYYRDLAASENQSSSQLMKYDRTTGPIKSQKLAKKATDLPDKNNKQRLIAMLENMKRGTKKDNLMRKTIVPCTIDMENVRNQFFDSRRKVAAKNLVVGALSENLWIARTGCQLWALSLEQLHRGLQIERNSIEETRDSVEQLVKRLLEEKDGISLLHPVFDLR
ncbi:PMS1 protein homolog 1-like isoform X2 [Venturia canescens]|uniref:PMS1 protein homolog 1-like isoform X2 n=1 Tax=Venturia canescens TaxID=32260 RepID=UPI001C9C78DB|nr:PMS1 protein homolog 1-like isoform X2 [Venturia canescens]